MHDIKAIRENPAAFDAGLARRGLGAQAASLVGLDEKRRAQLQALQEAQSRRNALSKEIGAAMGKKDQALADKLKAEVASLKDQISAGEEQERVLGKELTDALSVIPNIPLPSVPDGKDEHGNAEVRRWGTKPEFAYEPLQHFDLGEGLKLMDFEIAAKLSGARFVVLKGALARMERALAQFMLDIHTNEFGYSETYAPYMLRDEAMYGVGQLPKFAEDLFKTTSGHWLIPTAEASLTNLVREQVLDEAALPLRMTAYTPCFRAEAGAAGRDTRGMIRQHQFSKVELVSIATPEQADAEHERMTGCAEEILKRLNLHYRTMLLCTGDMGFGTRKTYDLEVWLPGQNAFREISSCSQFGEFQARRMEARSKAADAKQARYVHTLNGSALAVGRTMVAVMENYQNGDGSVTIPEALRPYMGGMSVIKRP
ncbi:serine--tRNA ligase [Aestuariivirga litoralis]|uniref:serine--tRNA ligase n=1 Tax=Aestuariivirga litoralis TaxID=2650924 RepID=UPI0018C7E9C2|nr:serine--tRNA ligase [Aestuariivirga litoralis]MBG1231401.1 serine--tRNA ligase [Aestuariivirga litoralis]